VIQADTFIQRARAHAFSLYAGVPCSYLKPFINYVIDDDELRYVGTANEGDAVAVVAGAELAGQRGVVMFQNSGFGNAVNPLTSLTHIFRIPMLVVVTLRGEPDGPPDEPQHELMGRITGELLDLIDIPWAWFPTEEEQVDAVLTTAVTSMEASRRPFALIMRKGSVAPHALQSVPLAQSPVPARIPAVSPVATRTEMLRAVQRATAPDDIVIATTGYTGRELYTLEDRPNQLYMVGSMGCAVSLGLGLAITCPKRRTIVLDGDGAALMRLGAFAMLGFERPTNLIHVLLDNGIHESTGGQTTLSGAVDFPAIAAACGYPSIAAAASPEALSTQLAARSDTLSFVHAPILPGVPDGMPRPTITPAEVAARLRTHIAATR